MLTGGGAMKAIIVDMKGKHAVALNNNGQFIKVKNTGNLNVGYEIDVSSKAIEFNRAVFYKMGSVAAMLMVVLGLSVGVYSYNLPYNYVNVDINPSVEITLNMYSRIIDVKALNADGEKLLYDDSYKNCKLEKGVKLLIDNAVEEGYLKAGEQNTVMLTVAGKNEEKVLEIQNKVHDVAKEVLDEDKVDSEILVENVVLERRKEAKELGISPGKLVLLEKLQEVNPVASIDEYKDKPVREIMKSIKEKKEDKKQNNGQKNQDGEKENAENILRKPSHQPEPTSMENTGISGNKGSANGEKYDKDKNITEKDNNDNKDNNRKSDKSESNNGKDEKDKSENINQFYNRNKNTEDKYKGAEERIEGSEDKLIRKDKEDIRDKDKNRDLKSNNGGNNKGSNKGNNKDCKDNGETEDNDDDKDNKAKGNEKGTDKYERDNKEERKDYNKSNKGR
jgi:hypothetical protein